MNKIYLEKIALTNFKGFAKTEMSFGERSEIRAENGQGKTTLRDAWFWVLGLNVGDVIPCQNNKEIPNLEIRVEAQVTLATNGGGAFRYTFVRTQKEVRRTNKDTGIEEKLNNESVYAIDGVEFILKNYKEKIARLFGVPYEKLEMLCRKEYFNSDNGEKWKWVNRRKELFDICAVDTFLASMVDKECYNLIAADIKKGLTTTEIKKSIKRELKGYADEKDRNAVLIADKQEERVKYSEYDFEALEAEKAQLEQKVTQLMLAASKEGESEELVTLRREKSEMQSKLYALTEEKRKAVQDVDSKLRFTENELNTTRTKGSRANAEKTRLKEELAALEAEQERLKASTWSGETVCPTCGQPIPAERIEASKAAFEQNKAARNAEIEEAINKKAEALMEAKTRLAELRETYATLASQQNAYKAEYDKLTTVPDKAINDLSKQVADLEKSIAGIAAATNPQSDLPHVLAPYRQRITEISNKLAYKGVIANLARRIEELKEVNRDLTDKEMLAKTKIKQLDEYVKEQVQFVTGAINGKFKNGVSFSLFSELYAGGEHDIKEECVCMLNGKTYNEMSYGERFFADLEVTATLQKGYGVNLPIFLDNAECFTGEVTAEQQLIMLYAAKGEKLGGVKIEAIL